MGILEGFLSGDFLGISIGRFGVFFSHEDLYNEIYGSWSEFPLQNARPWGPL
jgi:hypothetical protein